MDIESYKLALQNHDWYYQMAGGAAYQKGKASMQNLEFQAQHNPELEELFNEAKRNNAIPTRM
jgi:hypothetical protein